MSAKPFSSSGPRTGAVKEPPPDSPDFEVLPPEGKGFNFADFKGPDAIPRLIAFVMDNLLRVPGTKKTRIGLTPFLEALPVLGDGAVLVITALTMFEGVRRRVPKVVLAHMGANVLLTGLVGMFPVVGEIFSFWFKPSQRNYRLLMKYGMKAGAPRSRFSTWSDWGFVIGLVVVVLTLIGVFVGVGFFIASWLLHALVN
jgi:hypothetical protein